MFSYRVLSHIFLERHVFMMKLHPLNSFACTEHYLALSDLILPGRALKSLERLNDAANRRQCLPFPNAVCCLI